MLKHFSQIRFKRNLAFKCIKSWETLVETRDRVQKTASNVQKRYNHAKEEIKRLQNSTIILQKEIDI